MERVAVKPGYESLAAVLDEALTQAQAGKGKERHANDEPFDEQLICQLCRQDGIGFATGQAKKKTTESHRLEGEFGVKELLGAINYLAAAIIVRREKAGQGAKPAASTEAPDHRVATLVAEAITSGQLRELLYDDKPRVRLTLDLPEMDRVALIEAIQDYWQQRFPQFGSRPR